MDGEPEPLGVMLAACRRLLRPIVRMLLRHGVMQRAFGELCKEVYVEVATADYGLQGRPTNVSRTALLTGVDRKEVKRIRETLAGRGQEPQHRSRQDRLSRVLSGWHQDSEFCPGGTPLDLPLSAPAGVPSFATLVQRYGGDVPASAVLKELKRVGAVAEHDERVHAAKRYYMPALSDVDAIRRSGSVLEDVGNTVAYNLFPPRKAQSRFEGRATNARIAPAVIPEFHAFLEHRGQQFLEEVDAWLTAHEAPAGEEQPLTRLGVGVYWIQDGERQ